MTVDLASFQAGKCCHVVIENEASAARLCSSVRQFLIYSTDVKKVQSQHRAKVVKECHCR